MITFSEAASHKYNDLILFDSRLQQFLSVLFHGKDSIRI